MQILDKTTINTSIHKDFKKYGQLEWIALWVEMYGGFDGSHHKNWVLDQVMRIAKGTKVIVEKIQFENGKSEYLYSLDEPSKEYSDWLEEMELEGFDIEEIIGIAP